MSETTENHLDALKRYFGFDSFLDNQEDIVRLMLGGGDLCVVMPTGAGKSLCYQLPLLMRPGYGLVVSPLISLMKDQVDALREKGIPAAFVNSFLSQAEQQTALRHAAEGHVKLLYVAPERFHTPFFQNLLDHQPPSAMIVDEAHCISQWGHDFRPSYMILGEAAQRHSIPQICAFTATATSLVREDIKKQLKRPGMTLHVAGFKRPNLSFSVINCESGGGKKRELGKLLKSPCPTIIYASTRKNVDEVAETFGCLSYHAGMEDDERTEIQDRFMNDAAPVLTATNAFGMGIDRPDVRRVIHYNMPGSLEAYYQEAGRAGRDGEPADCVLLFSGADRYVQEFFIEMSNPSEKLLRCLYAELLKLSEERKSDTLEETLSGLLPRVPDAKSENHLSGAMRVLERCGYVERGFSGGGPGHLRITGDLGSLSRVHWAESTQRSRLISRVIKHFGDKAASGVSCSFESLTSVTGLNHEQVQRVLRALHGDCLDWTPPFAGRTTKLLKRESRKLDIDFKALEEKKDFEMSRLDEVISYARTSECRQNFLISYFGEDAGDWQCENCDICGASSHTSLREPSPAETEIIKVILSAVDEFSGRFGRGRISQLLAGTKAPEIVNCGLNRNRNFGLLRRLNQNNILMFMKSLENSGCIGRTEKRDYPCVTITSSGLEVMHGEKTVRLDFPETTTAAEPRKKKRSKSRQSLSWIAPLEELLNDTGENVSGTDNAADNSGADALFEELRLLRKKLAAEAQVPPYCVLHDSVMRELAQTMPSTIDEAAKIKGVGPGKMETVIPAFIDAIRKWKKTNGDG